MVMGNDLLATLVDQSQSKEYYDATLPMACPRCGEPFREGPPSEPGLLYCIFDGFQYPRDWDVNQHSGM